MGCCRRHLTGGSCVRLGPWQHLTITANSEAHSVGTFIRHMLRALKETAAGVDITAVDIAIKGFLSDKVAGAPLRAVLPLRLRSDLTARDQAKVGPPPTITGRYGSHTSVR